MGMVSKRLKEILIRDPCPICLGRPRSILEKLLGTRVFVAPHQRRGVKGRIDLVTFRGPERRNGMHGQRVIVDVANGQKGPEAQAPQQLMNKPSIDQLGPSTRGSSIPR
jgi:hypothetical protein